MRRQVIVIVLIIVIILVISKQNTTPELSPLMLEVDRRARDVARRCGYNVTFTLHAHEKSSHATNKQQVHLCQSCVTPGEVRIDKMLYVALHEVAHVINRGQDHDDQWKSIFQRLLRKAGDLNYLDRNKLHLA